MSSIGTYSTISSTCDESRRSDKENSHSKRENDKSFERTSMVRIEQNGRGRYNVVTLDNEENGDDDDYSSALSADFEDNDFDALVGEFFWYLRDKENGKATHLRQSPHRSLPVSTPETAPRGMGNRRTLTPRDREKRAHETHVQNDVDLDAAKLREALIMRETTKDVDQQKENVVGVASVLFAETEKDAKTIRDTAKEHDQGIQSTVHKAGEVNVLPSPKLCCDENVAKGADIDSTIPTKPADSIRANENRTSFAIKDPKIDNSSCSPISAKDNGDRDEAVASGNPAAHNCVNMHENSPPSASEESRKDNNTRQNKPTTPSRESNIYDPHSAYYAVWTKKGLMGRTPTPFKKVSSRIDDNTDGAEDRGEQEPSKESAKKPDSPQRMMVLKWPPMKSADSSSPRCSQLTSSNYEATFTTNTTPISSNASEEDTNEASPEFDADMELSRILDDTNNFLTNQTGLQTPVRDDDVSDSDMELSRVLDYSSGLNELVTRTKTFLARQQHILEDDVLRTPMLDFDLDLCSHLPNTDETVSHYPISADGPPEYESRREPDSLVAVNSPNSVVAETSSVVFELCSSDSICERGTQSNSASSTVNASSERCVDPEGYLVDDKSSCLTSPSLAPTPSNEVGVANHFETSITPKSEIPTESTVAPLSSSKEEETNENCYQYIGVVQRLSRPKSQEIVMKFHRQLSQMQRK